MQYENECFFAARILYGYSARMTIGSRLDAAMKAAGFKSQSALSRRSGVPQPTISRILSDDGEKGPETETIRKLADACRIPFDWLLQGPRSNEPVDPPTTAEIIQIDPDAIADQIVELIQLYRDSTPDGRVNLLDSARDTPKVNVRHRRRVNDKA